MLLIEGLEKVKELFNETILLAEKNITYDYFILAGKDEVTSFR